MRFPVALLTAALLGVGLYLLKTSTTTPRDPSRTLAYALPAPHCPSLMVYCAAGLKTPLETVAAQFRSETGTEIQLQFGGTASLLSAIRTAGRGDLFVSADSLGIDDGLRYGVVQEVLPFAAQKPVVAVAKGNPKKVGQLSDLKSPSLRLALTNPETAAIGRLSRSLLGDAYPLLAQKAVVTKPTVTDIASDLSLGAIDAAIVWDSTLALFPTLEAVSLPELSQHSEPASIGVLTSCKLPALALRFARYLAAPEKGGALLKNAGFKPLPGDAWSETPELLVYSGAVNRPAVEQLLREFSDHEGARITTVFNGCGVLCASMKAMAESPHPKLPDVYYACDLCFVPPVANHFPQVSVLTETEIGLVVRNENPHGIHAVADLARPGLKVGLCNAEQSTLGYMTRGILSSLQLETEIRKNVAVEVPTADFLINQMRAGALDAAIVYRINALPQSQHLSFLPIPHPGAKAVQPFSIRSGTSHPQLAQRLLHSLRKNKDRFEAAGFSWRGDELPVKSSAIEVPQWLRPNQKPVPTP
jgi:molybdate transport system substrate-binding protein